MKRILLASVCLMAIHGADVSAQGVRRCGTSDLKQRLAENNPDFLSQQAQYFAEQELIAQEHEQFGSSQKSTAQGVIPVVFHIMLTAYQIAEIGGTAGIAQRCVAQIDQLNRDFNKKNADSTLIPAGFKPLYGNANIQFALAHRKPTGGSTPGFNILTRPANDTLDIPENGGFGSGYAYSKGRYFNNASTQWDPSKYLNVWVIKPAGSLLGIATPPSMTGNGGLPLAERGLLIHYKTLGNKNYTTNQVYENPYNLGRTLVHEVGHYFEIWHVWGDDGGDCPGTGGQDDGIADTPPQADQSWGSPNGVVTDLCTSAGNGIMYQNFMDYTNDNRLLMFTNQQAAKMHTYIDASNAESHSLTQHPELTAWPTGIASMEIESSLNIFPNPSNGKFSISVAEYGSSLQNIVITNVVGQTVYEQNADANTAIYNIDISGIGKGIYFVQCHFSEGVVTKKIVLE